MNKAVFLDRDGTINIDFGYVHEINKLQFIDGAIEGLKILSNLGYKLIIITNQSGIGRGYYTLAEYDEFNNFMLKRLNEYEVRIDKVYMCPHVQSDNCNCRKPKLGLFYQAIKDFNIDLNKSFAIGDKERDLSICKVEGIQGILLGGEESNNFICKKNLFEAANHIKSISE